MTESIVNIDAYAAHSDIEAGALILDVREDDEFTAGRIAGAIHIPLGELPDRLNEIEHSRPIVCVCRVGGRSARAAFFLSNGGFDVRNLDGGMQAWALANLPMTSDFDVPRVI